MAEGAPAPRVWWSVGGRFGEPAWESLDSGDSSKGTAGRQGRERRVCRNGIDLDARVSDGYANFTRTGEFDRK
jgi:hypothetical protein